MVRPLVEYLEGNRIYICKTCQIHLSSEDLRISKAFTGGSGRAFLFDGGINYHYGIPEDKDLLTGRHTVQDLICNGCNTVIGWKYVTSQFNSVDSCIK